MTDLIDRTKLKLNLFGEIERCKNIPIYAKGLETAINIIKAQPKVDTELHAHWEQSTYLDEEYNVYQCSKCKEELLLIEGNPDGK